MGVEGALPTAAEIQVIRQEVARRISELETRDAVDQVDVARVNSDDKYVSKFFRHVFDHPGNQTEAAAKMIINTLKWRKEMGASTIKETDFLQPVFDKGALFSRNRCERINLMFCSVFSSLFCICAQGQRWEEVVGVLRVQTYQGTNQDGGHEEVLCLLPGETLQRGGRGADHTAV